MKKPVPKTELPPDNREKLLRAAPLLEAWFRENARPLPWRGERDPYRIWVSETMLQQTRIEAAMGYYPRFLEAFPTVEALAEAPEERVLKLWEGLGYYSRARNMHRAAKICCEQYGGALPGTAAELKKLPGVGAYTAGAVASLAFGEAVPAVDGNVLRILARFLNDERDMLQPAVKKEAEALLKAVLEQQERPGVFNEALMELGEVICLPNGSPRCSRCPLGGTCGALAAGTEKDLPNRGEARPRRLEKKTVLLLRCGGRTALEKRPDKGLLAGLYGFPILDGELGRTDLVPWLNSFGVPFRDLRGAGQARHVFTHVEWEMTAWEAETEAELPGFLYADRGEIETRYALPAAFKAFRERL